MKPDDLVQLKIDRLAEASPRLRSRRRRWARYGIAAVVLALAGAWAATRFIAPVQVEAATR